MPEKHERVEESAPGEAPIRHDAQNLHARNAGQCSYYMPNEQIMAVALSILLLALTPSGTARNGVKLHRVSSI